MVVGVIPSDFLRGVYMLCLHTFPPGTSPRSLKSFKLGSAVTFFFLAVGMRVDV